MSPSVFRFAPSPNGLLHLGHAFSALLNIDMARAAGGRLLLRIEDIDETRCRPQFEAAIYEDLAWLGIAWEEPVWRQSEHLDDYRAALRRLEAEGLIYPSFESRAEIARLVAEREAARDQAKWNPVSRPDHAPNDKVRARSDAKPVSTFADRALAPWPRDPDGAPLYPGDAKAMPADERARRLDSGAPYALRLDTAAAMRRAEPLAWSEGGSGPGGERGTVAAAPDVWGDVVLARKDIPTSYHLSVVLDDAAQGVTHVVRGQDLFWATGMHRLLQALLGLPAPYYHHHRLIIDDAGRKLAKSTRATGLRELRAQGVTPGDIRRMVGLG